MGRRGFTLVELMVVMLITMFVLYAATETLGSLVIQFKQQARVTETNISSVLGLEILRRDIHSAGFGLPWADTASYDNSSNTPSTFQSTTYNEAANPSKLLWGAGAQLPFDSSSLNDGNGTVPSSPPRALASGAPVSPSMGPGPNGSDYLAIKSAKAAINRAAGRFHMLFKDPVTNIVNVNVYSTPSENLSATDWAVVLSPDTNNAGTTPTFSDNLVSPGVQFQNVTGFASISITRLIYGIDSRTPPLAGLRFPFNRADYYISYRNVPEKCAHFDDLKPGPGQAGFDPAHPPSDRTTLANPGAGVLVKAVLDQADGDYSFATPTVPAVPDELPIAECVADFKVIYGLVNIAGTPAGSITPAADIRTLAYDGSGSSSSCSFKSGYSVTAHDLRGCVREVRVYILRHEGAFDPKFTFAPLGGGVNLIDVGEYGLGHSGAGNQFDLSTMAPGGAAQGQWQNFRWKVDRLIEKPIILRNP